MLYIVYIIIINNLDNVTDIDIIGGVLFLSWISIFPLALFLSLLKDFKFHPNKLEVIYLYGLFTRFYDYKDLKISDYVWSTSGILIQLPDRDQMTLGEKQYQNYSQVKKALEQNIPKGAIKVKLTNRFSRIMILLGAIIIIVFASSFMFK
ncbi:hypothetical protein TH63_10425 [Rufibacter radiotolerans]|uniref:Uncharacterized protein n=1 Tax=Rufibacter radiotolerans TaxID=1379910 RepID=A0A0H4W695_9BACT|nr:hypothetical protein TH63_10425 [Rufibacter radiotolerans]